MCILIFWFSTFFYFFIFRSLLFLIAFFLCLFILLFLIFPSLSCCFLFFLFCLCICTCYFISFPVSVSDFPLSLYICFFPSVFVCTFCLTIYVFPLLIVYAAVTHNIRQLMSDSVNCWVTLPHVSIFPARYSVDIRVCISHFEFDSRNLFFWE